MANGMIKTPNHPAAQHHPSQASPIYPGARGKKPVICAVISLAYVGGCEIINSKRRAKFALPEVKRGVIALAGGLTRLMRTVGKQRAIEMALTGRVVPVEETERWGLC
ncbi:predicted protein [Histoplasma mississippiense (nom. inval.)]|uniref:predicted protein n=1 Tax=Ajellomyces capsulatus (strain NAm1 / WU24) TaxID=2059318 RepID=UPI000157D0CB|nr:predicted protein [Histoplasma mississippiense (nom. inval.)]EDN11270.1 predicted protein [Histoplasma mississippiense (nom. inval.)]